MYPIDEHVNNAVRQVVGILEGSSVDDGLRVEHDQVSIRAFTNRTAVGKAKFGPLQNPSCDTPLRPC